MSRFYKMDPARWNTGTDNLSLEQEAAYLRVVNAIHLHDHPIRNNGRVLAGLWRCNERKAKRLLQELLDLGKLMIEGDFISNRRAAEDLSIRSQLSVERQSAGHRGGIESGKVRAKVLKDNDLTQASASTRIEENRREERTPKPPKGADDVEEEFEEWWKHVPRKVGKGAARRAFKSARKKADLATLRSAIRSFALSVQHKDAQFICHPSSWLNGERWSDQEGVDIPAMQATDAELLAQRVERAEGWLARHATIAGHMDRRDVADALIAKGHDYEKLREAGFSLPPSGKVIELGGRRDGQHASG